MNIEDLIVKYAIVLHRRFRMKEKLRFLQSVKQDLECLDCPVTIEMGKEKFSKSLNAYIGDVLHANVIVLAHYDTPVHQFIQQPYFPFGTKKKGFISLVNENIAFLLVFLLTSLAFLMIAQTSLPSLYRILFLIICIVAIIAVNLLYAKGVGNQNNFNKNTSSIIALMKVAEAMKGNRSIAYVLTDQECLNHHGDMMLQRKLKKARHQQIVIHLDCVGQGSSIVCGSSKNNASLLDQFVEQWKGDVDIQKIILSEEMIQSTSLQSYPLSFTVCAGDVVDSTVRMDDVGTSRDCNLDVSLLQQVIDAVVRFVAKR